MVIVVRLRPNGILTVLKSSHCVLTTSAPIFSSTWTISHATPYLVCDPNTTHTPHALVEEQADSLDGDIPLSAIYVGLEERPEDTGGDEAAAADSDEEGRLCVKKAGGCECMGRRGG
jgi:hypothetical protein